MKNTNKSSVGTTFHNTYLNTTVQVLKKALGNPIHERYERFDKSNYNWTLETDNGNVFTIYDWKEYREISENETIKFHIGGYSSQITEQAKNEILKAISDNNKLIGQH